LLVITFATLGTMWAVFLVAVFWPERCKRRGCRGRMWRFRRRVDGGVITGRKCSRCERINHDRSLDWL
jgi:hypothetical protein